MTREEKLNFIKTNYINSRVSEWMTGEEKEQFLLGWSMEVLQNAPTHLYKYRICNENNLAMLRNKTAWFSCPDTWNDPIDVTVKYDFQKDAQLLENSIDEIAIKMAFSVINQYIESFCKQKKYVTADEVKRIYYDVFHQDHSLNPDKIVLYLSPVVGEIPARQIAQKTKEAFALAESSQIKKQVVDGLDKMMTLNEIRDTMLMYSLSETYNNDHQWAVYADEGAGFCIGYHIKPKNTKDWSLIRNLLPIYYGDKQPLLITNMLNEALEYAIRPETFQELFDQEAMSLFISLNTKTIQWIGEEEWRFGLSKTQTDSNAVPFDFAESIYLGERIANE